MKIVTAAGLEKTGVGGDQGEQFPGDTCTRPLGSQELRPGLANWGDPVAPRFQHHRLFCLKLAGA